MATKSPTPLTAAVLNAIEQSGLTCNEIAKRSGVDKGALSRFTNHKGGLTLDSLNKLAPALGLRIVVDPPKKPARKKTP